MEGRAQRGHAAATRGTSESDLLFNASQWTARPVGCQQVVRRKGLRGIENGGPRTVGDLSHGLQSPDINAVSLASSTLDDTQLLLLSNMLLAIHCEQENEVQGRARALLNC